MRPKILVVDDSESIRFHLRAILEQAGFEVAVACDGIEGIASLQAANIDCVLCDVNMPNMDGMQMVKVVKADLQHKLLPILMLSTDGSQELRGQAQRAGAAGWIVKPYKDHQIVDAVKNLTNLARKF